MANSDRKLTRGRLYELVWSKPATELAPELGIPYHTLTKLCHDLNVPKPPPGYWQQVQFGQAPERPPLPEIQTGVPTEATIQPQQAVPPPWLQDSEVAAKIEAERDPENRIRVADSLPNPHPLVRETRAELDRVKPNDYGILRAYMNSRSLDVRVSKSSLHRALRIMDALIKALEARGYRVEVAKDGYVKTWVVVGREKLQVYLVEKSDRSDRPLSKEEQKKPPSYIYNRWMYTPSGKLTFMIDGYWLDGARKRWADKQGKHLEQQLNEIVIGLIAAGEIRRQLTLKREEEERQRREAELRRFEEARRREAEEARRKALEQKASSWIRSQNLRAFLKACEDALAKDRGELAADGSEAQWLRWAHSYADELDPFKSGYLDRILPKPKEESATG